MVGERDGSLYDGVNADRAANDADGPREGKEDDPGRLERELRRIGGHGGGSGGVRIGENARVKEVSSCHSPL